jgi:hypothetical protein
MWAWEDDQGGVVFTQLSAAGGRQHCVHAALS